ncbi:unnamed protein product [Closterium sp. NIES-53]
MDIAGRRFLPALFTLCVLLTLSFLAAPAAASASAQPIISRRHAAAFKDPSSVPEAQHGASLMSVVTAATTTANPSRRELGDSFGHGDWRLEGDALWLAAHVCSGDLRPHPSHSHPHPHPHGPPPPPPPQEVRS